MLLFIFDALILPDDDAVRGAETRRTGNLKLCDVSVPVSSNVIQEGVWVAQP